MSHSESYLYTPPTTPAPWPQWSLPSNPTTDQADGAKQQPPYSPPDDTDSLFPPLEDLDTDYAPPPPSSGMLQCHCGYSTDYPEAFDKHSCFSYEDTNGKYSNPRSSSSQHLGFSDLPSTPFPAMTPGATGLSSQLSGLPSTPGINLGNGGALGNSSSSSLGIPFGSSQMSVLNSQGGHSSAGGGITSQKFLKRRADLGFNALPPSSTGGSDMGRGAGARASIAIKTGASSSSMMPVPSGGAGLSSELGGGVQDEEIRVIWGTVVNIQDVMTKFRDFLSEFTPRHWQKYEQEHRRTDEGYDGRDIASVDKDVQNSGEGENESSRLMDSPLYPRLLEQMHRGEIRYLNLDAQHLLAYPESFRLYRQLVSYPEEVIPIMDHVLTETYISMFPDEEYDSETFGLRIRPFNLINTVNMRELNPGDIDKLISIKGLMIRASSVIPDMQTAFFKCTSCDWSTSAGIERGIITEPTQCGNPECYMRDGMELVHNRSVFSDKQICKLQETPDVIPEGQTPHTVSLIMHDELVDVSKPGDRLNITGIFRGVPVRVNPRKRTVQALYRTYIDVVHIQKSSPNRVSSDPNQLRNENEYVTDLQKIGVGVDDLENGGGLSADGENKGVGLSPEEIEEFKKLSSDPRLIDILSRSLAPSIHEMEDVKRGLLLQLFGGVRKQFKRTGAPRSRGDIHVLMVGDPGVSKSQLLQAVHGLSPRGQYTSGKGSSAVGLTAYVTRDPDTRQLVLESGALVLSDGGVCCIDEFDKMSDATRSILHEAMEQQTVSIAKAGIITSLNARAAILAAANPVDSKWNRELSIVENINLPPTLVSRFDLVFIVLDMVDEVQDRRLAKHLVSLYLKPDERTNPDVPGNDIDDLPPTIPTAKLTKYISYARRAIQPKISDEASDALVRAYVDLRKLGRDSNSTTAASTAAAAAGPGKRVTATARQLESMIRMSEAHARMRFSEVVEEQDVAEATRLMREALRESATDPRTGLIDLDLLNTGFAASDRRQLDAIKSETRRLLAESLSSTNNAADNGTADGGNGARSSATIQSWLNKMNDQSSIPVAPRLFEQVLRELETEGIIGIVGTGRNALVIVKRNSDSSAATVSASLGGRLLA
ncbi:MCM DNA helicase complex subunit [Mycoemilia scoparia]|uniref:DNA helicase n=1 Tax=Mycoemilia scoparia TaxID=417184 RepID=A0A9W7ZWC7_9FUNG|nr:MCM DNA helicase complex subunit [Mycoemilia scoparia]